MSSWLDASLETWLFPPTSRPCEPPVLPWGRPQVGEGAYGKVMKCRVRGADPEQWVAVKEFKIEVSACGRELLAVGRVGT